MPSFDEIMKYCPFLKEVIEIKIQEEVQTRDEKIALLEKDNAEINYTLMMGGLI